MKETRSWSLLRRPWLAIAVVAIGWSGAIALLSPGPISLGAAPLAVWEDDSLDVTWQRDPEDRWVYAVHEGFDAGNSPGVWLDLEPAREGQVQVEFRWRRGDVDQWNQTLVFHRVVRDRLYFDLSEHPDWSGVVGQLGARVLHDADFRVRRIVVEGHGAVAGLHRAMRELFSGEVYGAQQTVNLLMGPTLLGVSLTFWVGVTLALLLLFEVLVSRLARQPIRTRRLVVAVGLGWLLIDLRFSMDLFANAMDDFRRFPTVAAADASAQGYGPQLREVVESVRTHVPPDASMAMLSDYPFDVIRSKYLFYPRRLVGPLRTHTRRRPEYILIYRYTNQTFDAAKGILTLGNGRRFRVKEIVARPTMRLMRVLRILPMQRGKKKP